MICCISCETCKENDVSFDFSNDYNDDDDVDLLVFNNRQKLFEKSLVLEQVLGTFREINVVQSTVPNKMSMINTLSSPCRVITAHS